MLTKRAKIATRTDWSNIDKLAPKGYPHAMSIMYHRIVRMRSSVENSRIWKFATKTVFRLVVSSVCVLAAALALMVGSPFLFFFMPVLGIAAFAGFAVLMILVRMLASEARRRENRT